MTETRVPIQERIDIWEVIDAAATMPFGFMPFYTANKIAEALNRQGKPLLGSKNLVLGIAFKPDIDDARNSPAVALIRTLRGRGADVRYHIAWIVKHSRLLVDATGVTRRMSPAGGMVIRL
jgi:UDP-N-acetyl-D-mannosaminuronate dehydrogenase